MGELIREDLPNYGHRLESDEDLAALRGSPQGVRLRALVEALAPAYSAAAKRGVEAMIYEPGPTRRETAQGPQPLPGFTALRIGVYDSASKRFVPLAPTVRGGLGAAIDAERGLVLVVAGGMITGTCWVANPEPRDGYVYDLAQPGRLLYHAKRLQGNLTREGLETPAVYLRAKRDSIRVTYMQVNNDPVEKLSREHRGGRLKATKSHLAIVAGTVPLRGNGALRRTATHAPPEGMSVRGRELRIAEPARTITIGAGHSQPSIVASPDGSRVLLVTVAAQCADDTGGVFTRHLAELVDLASGTVVELSSGRGVTVDGRFAPDGTLYLQLGDELRRYEPGSTTAGTDLPGGLRLVTPLMTPAATPECDGC